MGAFTKLARNLLKSMFDGKPDDSLIQTGWGFDSIGVTPEQEKLMWKKIDSIPNWWLEMETMPETNLLKPLCDKHRVIFITNRKDGTGIPVEKQSAEWLVRNFGIFHPAVLLSNEKGPLAKGLKLDAYIDDRDKNTWEVIHHSPSTQTYILDATYNQHVKDVPRVNTFNDFARKFL